MPNKCLELMREGETLPQMCMDLHMSVVVSSDPLDDLTFVRYIKCLEAAVANWDHTNSRAAIFDNAVLNLIICTLSEIRLRLSYSLVYKHLDWKSFDNMSEFFAKNPDIRFDL